MALSVASIIIYPAYQHSAIGHGWGAVLGQLTGGIVSLSIMWAILRVTEWVDARRDRLAVEAKEAHRLAANAEHDQRLKDTPPIEACQMDIQAGMSRRPVVHAFIIDYVD